MEGLTGRNLTPPQPRCLAAITRGPTAGVRGRPGGVALGRAKWDRLVPRSVRLQRSQSARQGNLRYRSGTVVGCTGVVTRSAWRTHRRHPSSSRRKIVVTRRSRGTSSSLPAALDLRMFDGHDVTEIVARPSGDLVELVGLTADEQRSNSAAGPRRAGEPDDRRTRGSARTTSSRCDQSAVPGPGSPFAMEPSASRPASTAASKVFGAMLSPLFGVGCVGTAHYRAPNCRITTPTTSGRTGTDLRP